MEHKCSSLVTICVSGIVRQGRNSSLGQFFFHYLKFSGKTWPQKRSWRIHCAFTFFPTLVIRYILQKRYVYITFYVTGTKRCLCMSGYVTVQSADETKYMCGEYYSVTSCGRQSHGVEGYNTMWNHVCGWVIWSRGTIQCDIMCAAESCCPGYNTVWYHVCGWSIRVFGSRRIIQYDIIWVTGLLESWSSEVWYSATSYLYPSVSKCRT